MSATPTDRQAKLLEQIKKQAENRKSRDDLTRTMQAEAEKARLEREEAALVQWSNFVQSVASHVNQSHAIFSPQGVSVIYNEGMPPDGGFIKFLTVRAATGEDHGGRELSFAMKANGSLDIFLDAKPIDDQPTVRFVSIMPLADGWNMIDDLIEYAALGKTPRWAKNVRVSMQARA